MASPTLAEIETQGSAWLKVFKDLRAHLDGTFLTDVDAVSDKVEGDFTPVLPAVAAQMRGAAAALLAPSVVLAGLGPVMREHGKLINAPELSDFGQLMARIYTYRADNAKLVTSRQITYNATAAGGGNAGNGTLARLTVDERNYNLEGCHVELKTAECVVDANSGALQHAEVFEFRGVQSSKDYIDLSSQGSGERFKVQVTAKHAGSGAGGSLLSNASFESYNSGAAQPFTGWTVDTPANTAQVLATYYRGYPGGPAVASLASLKFTGNAVVSQAISLQNLSISRYKPYCLTIAYNREVGVGDGTLRIRMGAHTTTVALAAQAGWNKLTLPLTTSCWLRTFDEQNLDVTVELSARTTGYVLVDDFIFAPLDYFDGTWWWLVGGATPFLLRDVFTVTDAGGAATTGILQYWFWRSGLGCLPSGTGGAVTWADP